MTLLQGVIFDLDGVIADTVPAHFAAWKRMFEEEGYAFDDQVYHDKVDGRRRFDGARAVMVDATPDEVSAAAARKDAYFLRQIEQGQFEVFADTLDFLRACRADGIVLATASSSRNVRLVLEKAGIAEEFAAIVGGDDVSNGKPHPDIFLLAAKRLGVPPAACVVIEDAISGVAAAKAGGFVCIGLDRTGQTERLAGADVIVDSMSRLTPRDIENFMRK